jgi:hypothetical protein
MSRPHICFIRSQSAPWAGPAGKFTHPVIEELFTLSGSCVFGDLGRICRRSRAVGEGVSW